MYAHIRGIIDSFFWLGARLGAPITAAEFNDDGTYFCYATGYDWSHGVDDSAPRGATLYCHEVADSEVKRKAK